MTLHVGRRPVRPLSSPSFLRKQESSGFSLKTEGTGSLLSLTAVRNKFVVGGEGVAAQRQALVTSNLDSKPPLTLPSFPRKRESSDSWRQGPMDSRFRGNDGHGSLAGWWSSTVKKHRSQARRTGCKIMPDSSELSLG
jgi:hypothetical protein